MLEDSVACPGWGRGCLNSDVLLSRLETGMFEDVDSTFCSWWGGSRGMKYGICIGYVLDSWTVTERRP